METLHITGRQLVYRATRQKKSAKVWILDEPFTALDVKGVEMLEASMKKHVTNGGMIITTSHQPLSDIAGSHRTFDLEYRF